MLLFAQWHKRPNCINRFHFTICIAIINSIQMKCCNIDRQTDIKSGRERERERGHDRNQHVALKNWKVRNLILFISTSLWPQHADWSYAYFRHCYGGRKDFGHVSLALNWWWSRGTHWLLIVWFEATVNASNYI